MNKLINNIKKIKKKDINEWYTVYMIAPGGTHYRQCVRAKSEDDVIVNHFQNMPEGTELIKIDKGYL